MNQSSTLRASKTTIALNKVKTFFSKPHNVILLLLGIVLTFTTVAPIVAIVEDTFKIHAGTIDAHLTGQASGFTTVNYIDLFTSRPYIFNNHAETSRSERASGLSGILSLSLLTLYIF